MSSQLNAVFVAEARKNRMVSYRVHINDVGHISYARAANRTAIGADRNIVIAAPRNNLRHGEHEAGHMSAMDRAFSAMEEIQSNKDIASMQGGNFP